MFWASAIGAGSLAAILAWRGTGLPVGRRQIQVYAVISLVGNIIPNLCYYEAARHLPAGWISVLVSLVPIFAFPIALGLRLERFSGLRLAGLLAGLGGVMLLVWPAEAGLDGTSFVTGYWVIIASLAAVAYACEGNYLARWGAAGLDPLQVLCGASIISAGLCLPLALVTASWISPVPPFGSAHGLIVLMSLISIAAYTSYIWLVAEAGSVFAAQVSYLVTGFGVLWSMLLLGESFGPVFWLAMALMFVGLFLVQPRAAAAACAVESETP